MNVNNELKSEIAIFLNTITTKYKNLVYNSIELEDPPFSGFFSSNPYKGYMMSNGENIFGYKKYRVVFEKDYVVIIEKSYPNINERLYYHECHNKSKFKSFFSSIKSYVKNDVELQELTNFIENEIISIVSKIESKFLAIKDQEAREEAERLTKLKSLRESEISSLDKNSDGMIDLIENDFNKLLNKHQKSIISVDKNYIHQFVKAAAAGDELEAQRTFRADLTKGQIRLQSVHDGLFGAQAHHDIGVR